MDALSFEYIGKSHRRVSIMRVAEIRNGEVMQVLLLSQTALAEFQAATQMNLIPIPDGGDVITGDLYDVESNTFHRPVMEYIGEGMPRILSLEEMNGKLSALSAVVDAILDAPEQATTSEKIEIARAMREAVDEASPSFAAARAEIAEETAKKTALVTDDTNTTTNTENGGVQE